ncbi:hypothetical protein EVG20_g8829 [Dentipellis fragilis]|uniref:Uncharacterized protein n=1 Tax=Dentipellis fragilis TaxID=205917 RepID=A0A4Y9Y513_9AGAM|nr:hypothetical protein EVG20_g8829 [Dentipellis fragilis]
MSQPSSDYILRKQYPITLASKTMSGATTTIFSVGLHLRVGSFVSILPPPPPCIPAPIIPTVKFSPIAVPDCGADCLHDSCGNAESAKQCGAEARLAASVPIRHYAFGETCNEYDNVNRSAGAKRPRTIAGDERPRANAFGTMWPTISKLRTDYIQVPPHRKMNQKARRPPVDRFTKKVQQIVLNRRLRRPWLEPEAVCGPSSDALMNYEETHEVQVCAQLEQIKPQPQPVGAFDFSKVVPASLMRKKPLGNIQRRRAKRVEKMLQKYTRAWGAGFRKKWEPVPKGRILMIGDIFAHGYHVTRAPSLNPPLTMPQLLGPPMFVPHQHAPAAPTSAPAQGTPASTPTVPAPAPPATASTAPASVVPTSTESAPAPAPEPVAPAPAAPAPAAPATSAAPAVPALVPSAPAPTPSAPLPAASSAPASTPAPPSTPNAAPVASAVHPPPAPTGVTRTKDPRHRPTPYPPPASRSAFACSKASFGLADSLPPLVVPPPMSEQDQEDAVTDLAAWIKHTHVGSGPVDHEDLTPEQRHMGLFEEILNSDGTTTVVDEEGSAEKEEDSGATETDSGPEGPNTPEDAEATLPAVDDNQPGPSVAGSSFDFGALSHALSSVDEPHVTLEDLDQATDAFLDDLKQRWANAAQQPGEETSTGDAN